MLSAPPPPTHTPGQVKARFVNWPGDVFFYSGHRHGQLWLPPDIHKLGFHSGSGGS